jgi:hypothetical protein
MVVSNLVFDVILFGALLLAALIDGFFPATGGVVSLLVAGGAVYIAAQEWCDSLARRKLWTQDAFSTAVALSVLGFIYFWWRNTGDFALLILSIGLMMASLMVAIGIIAAVGAMFKEGAVAALSGFVLTFLGAFALGVFGGVLTLLLSSPVGLLPQLLVIGVALFVWKLRENMRPPLANEHATEKDLVVPVSSSAHAFRWALIPRGGTLLDRFVPVLVLAVIMFFMGRQVVTPDQITAPVAAQPDNAATEPAAP